MKKKPVLIALLVAAVLLAAEFGFIAFRELRAPEAHPQMQETQGTVTEGTAPETEPATEGRETLPVSSVPVETEAPSEAPAQAPTEPGPQEYTLTFVGDCTLGSTPSQYGIKYSLIHTVGENYSYPFKNVAEYFQNDDFTIVNLETVLADEGRPDYGKRFAFRGPTAYTNILTSSSVEAVTLANNHTMDYGKDGYAATKEALEGSDITYVEKDGTALYTTESGLKIGLYGAAFQINVGDMQADIARLRKEGAEIVVAAFHWGIEGSYRPNSTQEQQARQAIDAGADIVYGHHPHVLQRIEEYKDGVICYSLGNFCFGGNNYPPDLDSVIFQQKVIREEDGSVRLGERTLIPVSVSSLPVQNNFQPTPYEEGSREYDRVLSKLDGTFKGGNLVVDYDKDKQDATEAPAATEVPAPAATEAPAPAATEAPAPAATEAPPAPPTEAAPPAAEGPTE